MQRKAIGILGGMGPEASVYMYRMLIELSFLKFNAKNNDHFPEIVLDSVPVPDFISNDKNKNKALKMLKGRTRNFSSSSTLCLSIACNTAHVLIEELQQTTEVPFISMIDEVTQAVFLARCQRAGIIATPSTIRFGLYQKALEKKGIDFVVPSVEEIKKMEQVIRNVIRGKQLKNDTTTLFNIANGLRMRGADCIILGCTEIPLVFPKKYSLPVFNSVEILSLSLLRKYYKSHKMSLQI